jgi:hypothetical protein
MDALVMNPQPANSVGGEWLTNLQPQTKKAGLAAGLKTSGF